MVRRGKFIKVAKRQLNKVKQLLYQRRKEENNMPETVLEEAIEELTKMYIKQDVADRKNKKEAIIQIKRKDYIKQGINLLKLLKKQN
jgi:hypothetical protein